MLYFLFEQLPEPFVTQQLRGQPNQTLFLFVVTIRPHKVMALLSKVTLNYKVECRKRQSVSTRYSLNQPPIVLIDNYTPLRNLRRIVSSRSL